MATSVWHEDSQEGGLIGDRLAEETGPSEARLTQMRLVRQFVAQLIKEQGGDASSTLSDQEWSRLCEAAGDADSEEAAIARVVLRAYRGGDPSPNPAEGIVPGPPSAVPEPSPVQSALDQPPWPAITDEPTQAMAPEPVPLPPVFEAMQPSFVGKAWPVVDGPVPVPARTSPPADSPSPSPVVLAPPGPVPSRTPDFVADRSNGLIRRRGQSPARHRPRRCTTGQPACPHGEADRGGGGPPTGTTAHHRLMGPQLRRHHPALRGVAALGNGHHPASHPDCTRAAVCVTSPSCTGQGGTWLHTHTGDDSHH